MAKGETAGRSGGETTAGETTDRGQAVGAVEGVRRNTAGCKISRGERTEYRSTEGQASVEAKKV